MYKVLINVEEIDPEMNQKIVNYLLFEVKDSFALKIVDNILHEVYPGDYRVLEWTNKDDTMNMSVWSEFKSIEDYMFWRLAL